MALRDAIVCKNQRQIWGLILKKLGFKPYGNRKGAVATNAPGAAGTDRQCMCFVRAGAPTSNNESYAHTGIGDLLLDTTNNDLYRCSAYSSSTSHTWTKIAD